MKNLMVIIAAIVLAAVISVGFTTPDDPPVTYEFVDSTEVRLTATPDPGWVFSHWSGDIESEENPITIIMTQDMGVTAHFFRFHRLEITVEGGGTVDIDNNSNN